MVMTSLVHSHWLQLTSHLAGDTRSAPDDVTRVATNGALDAQHSAYLDTHGGQGEGRVTADIGQTAPALFIQTLGHTARQAGQAEESTTACTQTHVWRQQPWSLTPGSLTLTRTLLSPHPWSLTLTPHPLSWPLQLDLYSTKWRHGRPTPLHAYNNIAKPTLTLNYST